MPDQVAVLESIRDVLSGKNPAKEDAPKAEESAETPEDAEEILDLTKMVNDDGSVTDLNEQEDEEPAEEKIEKVAIIATEDDPIEEPQTQEEESEMATTDTTKGDDVLDEIDKLMEDEGAASEDINPDDLDAMFDSPAFETPEKPAEETQESITDDTVELELTDSSAEKASEAAAEESTPETPKSEEAMEETDEKLISDESSDKAKSAIDALIKVTGKDEKAPKPSTPSPAFRNGETVEDLVMESLKPMLAKWLDENLSSLVEEIVQKEISRIIPK